MNAWDIERIKEIMKERGLKASDLYRDDNYGTDTQFHDVKENIRCIKMMEAIRNS